MNHERGKQTRNSWQKPLSYSLPGVSSTISQLFLLLPRTISLRHDICLRAVVIVYFLCFFFRLTVQHEARVSFTNTLLDILSITN
jgi:hypothetical protein